jgi:fucose permease
MIERYRGLSRTARSIFWIILVLMILALLYTVVTSQAGLILIGICCGGAVLVLLIGLISERGMRR